MSTTRGVADWGKRRGPEAALLVLSGLIFLGALGSVDLWGKREQRASAEAIDTVEHQHWLIAEIQGRPRLEKPPLPRWMVAGLMVVTGRRDEWVVRLPGALAALGMVGLVYDLGRRLGGRSVGLASALMLTSLGFFVVELRQGGNDGPLAFFTTLALYAAWRRLHAEGAEPLAGPRAWNLWLYTALGLGMLCKGPIVVAIVAVTVVPYLACTRRLRSGLALLADLRGAVLFLLLALSWPVPVLLDDPNALKVWLLEMGQKTGAAGIPHPYHGRHPLVAAWPWMTLPWSLVATLALILPFRRKMAGKMADDRWPMTDQKANPSALSHSSSAIGHRPSVIGPAIWFPWWWGAGNLAMFGLWAVAKPNYFLPCLPGVALLCGAEWVRLTREGRAVTASKGEGAFARGVLQAHWVILFVAAMVAPVIAWRLVPTLAGGVAAISLTVALAAVISAWAWRRGADALALMPLIAAAAVLMVVGYGVLAPTENARRGHRSLAATLDRLLPADARTVMFFHELDEGLSFYQRGRDFQAIPGSRPEYNDTYAAIELMRHHRFERDPARRLAAQKQVLLNWLRRPDRPASYVLLRDIDYARVADSLGGLAEPVYHERDLHRNEFVLLRVIDHPAVASGSGVSRSR